MQPDKTGEVQWPHFPKTSPKKQQQQLQHLSDVSVMQLTEIIPVRIPALVRSHYRNRFIDESLNAPGKSRQKIDSPSEPKPGTRRKRLV